jgi:putative spermidine/putrescine transport system ATP-binding protein
VSRIEIEGLTKSYGGLMAVAELNLSIGAGELIVFVGPSGCGKTTTLRMIAGFVEPTSGTIRIGEKDVTRLPPRLRNIGMVFQDYALFPSMTVRQNIAFGLEEHGVARPDILRRVDEMLDLIRMRSFAERLPRELSGGQQRRVALARALAYKPSVLLMDEPLGALDQKLREEMQREFVNIQRQLGITTVFVTHDQQEAMALADRILVMNAGRVEQLGRSDELYETPASLFTATFIGRSNQFSGRVRHCETSMASIDLEIGATVTVRAVSDGLAPGDEVLCIVRPERLHVEKDSEPATGPNRISATLQRSTYLGSFIEVIGTTEKGGEVILQMDPVGAAELALPGPAILTFGASEAFAFRKTE